MDMVLSPAARAAVSAAASNPSDISAPLMAAAHSVLDPLARGDAVNTAAQVIGAFRVELTGFTVRMVERLKAMGLVSEIIAWKPRLFVPTGANGPAIVGALMERYPLVRIADRSAA